MSFNTLQKSEDELLMKPKCLAKYIEKNSRAREEGWDLFKNNLKYK